MMFSCILQAEKLGKLTYPDLFLSFQLIERFFVSLKEVFIVHGAWTIFWREMVKYKRRMMTLFVTIVQPVLWILLFGVALGSTIPEKEGSISYVNFLIPGIIGLSILFSSLFASFNVLLDKEFGLTKEILMSPTSRNQAMVGYSLSGLAKSLIQAFAVLLLGVFLIVSGSEKLVLFGEGEGFFDTFIWFLTFVLIIVIFSFGFLFMAMAIAARMTSHGALQALTTMLTLPLFFASEALYPSREFPFWLAIIAKINPLTYCVRVLQISLLGYDFRYGDNPPFHYEFADIVTGFIMVGLFTLIMFYLAIKSFQKIKLF